MGKNRYIHFLYSDYLRFGTDTPKKDAKAYPLVQDRAQQALQAQRIELLKDAKSSIINDHDKKALKQQYENSLNWIFNPNISDQGDVQRQELYQYIIKKFNEEIASKKGVFINSATLDASMPAFSGRSGQSGQRAYGNLGSDSNKAKTHKLESIRRRLAAIETKYNALKVKPNYSKTELENRRKEIETMATELSKLLSDSVESIEAQFADDGTLSIFINNISVNNKNFYLKGSLGANFFNAKENSLTTNGCLNLMHQVENNLRISAALNQFKGEVLELIVSLGAELTAATTRQEIDKLFEAFKQGVLSTHTGHIETTNIIKQKNFGNDLSSILGKNYSSAPDSFGNYYAVKARKDKVDAIITLGENKNIGASIKNYNFKNGLPYIHLLSGSGPLYYLQGYSDFIYNYLNIVIIPIKNNRLGEIRSWNPIMDAHRVLKLSLALVALKGGLEKVETWGPSQQAEVFIVNDISNPGIKLIFMDDIFEEVAKALYTTKIDPIKMEDWPPLIFSKWVENWTGAKRELSPGLARTVATLADFQKMKLSISVSKDLIKGLM